MLKNLSVAVALAALLLGPSGAEARNDRFPVSEEERRVPRDVDPSRTDKIDEITASTVYAELIRAVDGDTIEVYAYPWPRMVMRASIDLIGIAGPSVEDAVCEKEKKLGQRAVAFVEGLRVQKMELYGLRMNEAGDLQGFALVRLLGSSEDIFLSNLLEENGYARSWLRTGKPDWCR
ncbi:MAG: hypothetical protein AAGB03_11265 [Pseudomonadota bacterium]